MTNTTCLPVSRFNLPSALIEVACPAPISGLRWGSVVVKP